MAGMIVTGGRGGDGDRDRRTGVPVCVCADPWFWRFLAFKVTTIIKIRSRCVKETEEAAGDKGGRDFAE